MSEKPEALRLADELKSVHGHRLALDAAAELRRLHQHELAHIKWLEKTEWVQDTAHYSELGEHRADVIKQRFDRLHEVNQELLEALKQALGTLLSSAGCHDNPRSVKTIKTIRAAIAKGEQA